MNLMIYRRGFVVLAVIACLVSSSVTQAQLIYEQTFNPPNDPDGYAGTIEDSGWIVDTPGPFAYSGTYQGNFAPDPPGGLRDAANNNAINGNTGLFVGAGGPLTEAEGMYYVTDGLGGFTAINPADHERLIFSIYANLQGGGADDHGSFAIRVRDPDDPRSDPVWYAQTTPMAMPDSSDDMFNLRRLEYDATSGWEELTLSPVARGAAAPDLTGMLITGVGIVHSITNPEGDFSSWNYADYRITEVPEPASALLLACAAPLLLRQRRKPVR